MKLMTKEIENKLPPIYSQEGKGDKAMVYEKYFTPDSCFTWYVTEYDKDRKEFFGLVVGLEIELGYFSLKDLESAKGPLGISVERDLHFVPATLAQIKKEIGVI